MALPPELTDEERAGLEKCGFKPDTAYMEVPRCETCRFWGPFEDLEGRKECRRVHDEGARVGPQPEELMVAPDFGCVQWERKE